MGLTTALKTYLGNSSIHGLSHIANTSKPLAERLFWAVICTWAGYATVVLIDAAYHSYLHNSVSITLETDYLRWNTTFPALSVCEGSTLDKINKAAESIYGPDRNLNIEMFLRDIAFYDGTCRTCNDQCFKTLNCSGDLEYLTRSTRKSCPDLIKNCFWNGQPFECCSHFLPLQTELGLCYTINSVNTIYPEESQRLHFSLNRTSGPGTLTLTPTDDLKLFMHSPEDVPTIDYKKSKTTAIYKGVHQFVWLFSVREIINDKGVESLPLKQRNCRFLNEDVPRFYKVYSHSSCTVWCRAQAQIERCNCTHHLMPKIANVKTCNLDGLRCITKNSEWRFSKCLCSASCMEPQYIMLTERIVKDSEISMNESQSIDRQVILGMHHLPFLRFKRIVVRSMLDLVVSMGGTIGLFLGASLLSTVEILYFLFVRNGDPSQGITKRRTLKGIRKRRIQWQN